MIDILSLSKWVSGLGPIVHTTFIKGLLTISLGLSEVAEDIHNAIQDCCVSKSQGR